MCLFQYFSLDVYLCRLVQIETNLGALGQDASHLESLEMSLGELGPIANKAGKENPIVAEAS